MPIETDSKASFVGCMLHKILVLTEEDDWSITVIQYVPDAWLAPKLNVPRWSHFTGSVVSDIAWVSLQRGW